MDVVDKLYSGYGEARRAARVRPAATAERGQRVPDKEFPRLDFIKSCYDRHSERTRTVTRCRTPRLPRWRRAATAIRSPCSARIRDDAADGSVVRRIQPAARAVDLRLVATGELRADARGCRRGLFETDPAGRRSAPDYRLRVTVPATATWSRSTTRIATAASSRDFDLHLFGEGTHYRAFEKLGAHRIQRRARRPACISRCGRRTPIASASSATSTAGTDACTRCGCSSRPASGRSSSRTCADGEKIQVRDPHARRRAAEEERSVRRGVRGAAADGVGRPRHLAATPGTTRSGWPRGQQQGGWLRPADGDLRGAPRLVGARARGRQPLPHLSRAGARGSCRT